MSEREDAVNRRLRMLDDAHRLGRLPREQYRAQRRQVLATLRETSAVITARKSLPSAVTTQRGRATSAPRRAHGDNAGVARPMMPMQRIQAWKHLIVLGVGAVLVVVLVYLLLRNM